MTTLLLYIIAGVTIAVLILLAALVVRAAVRCVWGEGQGRPRL